MADEENKQVEEAPEEKPSGQPEAAAEAPAEETPAAEETAAAEAPADAETPSPKQIRKRARSIFKGPAREPVSGEQRVNERAEIRKAKAASRRRWRQARRTKAAATESGPATTSKAESELATRKTRQGLVVSSKGQKTITVQIDHVRRHRTYGKVLHETTTLHAHDEANEAGEGDTVRVIECRPLSRTKRWRLVEILEKAK